MPHHPQPFFRSARAAWFVQIRGKQIKLGRDREAAFGRYHALMSQDAAPASQDASVKPAGPAEPLRLCVELIDAFLDWCQIYRGGRTYDWYREKTQYLVDAIPPSLTVAQLKPFHVYQCVDAHADWSDGMKRGVMIAVQRAFNWAVQVGHIDRSPVAYLEKPKAGKRELVLAPADFQRLLKLIGDEAFKDLLTLAWETGARPQELLRVEARHVELDNARWVFPEKEAKGKKRIRIVHLTDACLAVTTRLVAKHPEGPLLRNEDGRGWTRHAVSCRFLRLKKKLGAKLCLYNFRHSFCDRAIKSGVDPITLANLLGHSDTAMIARVYSHLQQDPAFLKASLKKVAG